MTLWLVPVETSQRDQREEGTDTEEKKYIKGRGRKRNANVEKGTVVSRNQNGGGISVGLEGDLSRGRHQKTQREERNMIEKGKRTVKHISGCQIYSASYSGHSD